MKTTLSLRNFVMTLMLIILSIQSLLAAPVEYTLTASDITLNASGYITACSYDFSANTDGTDLIIPSNLGVLGIVDASIDWMDNIDGDDPFVEKNITSIVLPTTLKYIGEYAFQKNNLTALSLHEGLVEIGRDAFLGNKIASVAIPASVKTIGSNCFYDNAELTSMTFAVGSRLTYIGSHVFVGTAVATITLPIPVVPGDNFEYWIQLSSTEVTYPGGTVVNPQNYAFIAKYVYTLTNDDVEVENGVLKSLVDGFGERFLIIPSRLDGQDVTEIAGTYTQRDAMFYGMGIRELTLPSTLKTIGTMSFNLNQIQSLLIPASVTNIKAYAFWGALSSSEPTVTFETNSQIREIESDVFVNNVGLTVTLPSPTNSGHTFTHWLDGDDTVINGGEDMPSFRTSYTAVFDVANSINTDMPDEVSIYPNPTKGQVTIKGAKDGLISIYNMSGINVMQIEGASIMQNIDISGLPVGMYLIKVNQQTYQLQKK